MSKKLKYYAKKVAKPMEFPNNVVRIELPNGDEYTLQYNEQEQGLTINKAYSETGKSTLNIVPHVSNQITLK